MSTRAGSIWSLVERILDITEKVIEILNRLGLL
jgi:hypothetical protein